MAKMRRLARPTNCQGIYRKVRGSLHEPAASFEFRLLSDRLPCRGTWIDRANANRQWHASTNGMLQAILIDEITAIGLKSCQGMRDSSIASSEDIKFACTRCGQRIIVERSAAGLNGACPNCNAEVTVPHASGASQPALDPPPVGSPPATDRENRHSWEHALDEARAETARQQALSKRRSRNANA